MRLFGFVLLIAGFLLCVSIVWAALGFLMMGFGLICLLIAERNRKRAPEPDVSDSGFAPPIDAARPDQTVARQAPSGFLEPTFAAASPRADLSPRVHIGDSPVPEENWNPPVESAVAFLRVDVGDRRTPPPPRSTRSSEFDRIRALRTERGSARSEPEFRDFAAPIEREPRKPPALPEHSVSAEAVVPPPIAVAPPIVVEPKVAANEPRPEIASAKPAAVEAERSGLFDDADDLADLFNKFDLGKD